MKIKNSTKRKIIDWVTKVLKYYPPMELPYNTQTCAIIKVEITERFIPNTFSLDKSLLYKLSDSLYFQNLITFITEDIPHSKFKLRIAKLEVIKR